MSDKKTKVCSKCKVVKSVDEYNKDKSKKNGTKSQCKECRSKSITKQKEEETELKEYNNTLLLKKKSINKKLKEYKEEIYNTKSKRIKNKYVDLSNNEINKLNNLEEEISRRTIEYKANKIYGNLRYNFLKKEYEKALNDNKDNMKSADEEDKDFYQENIDYYNNKLKTLANDFPYSINFNEETFFNVTEKIKTLLNEGYVVKLEGRIKLNGEKEFKDYNSKKYFASIRQLEAYINAIEDSSDMEEMFFTGSMKYGIDKFKKVNKSKRGDGSSFQYSIKEYEGKYCYIPTENQCFLKCYKWLNDDNQEKDIDKLYKEFCFKENNNSEKNRSFIMSNTKFSRFNTFMEDKVQYYDPKDRHLYPKIEEEKYNYVYYLHNPYNHHIGHYCLIYKNNKREAIKEIEDNYEQKWKEIDEEDVKNVHLIDMNPTKDDNIHKNTYVYDIETYQDENGKHIPYAIASINLNIFRGCVCNYIRDEDNNIVKKIPEEQLNKLLNKHIKYFIGEDCVQQFFKYLGDINKEKILLFAHNGSGFDSELIIEQINLSSVPVKKGSKLLNVNIKNPYITDRWIEWYKKNNGVTKKVQNKGKFVNVKITPKQKISLRCSMQHVNTKLSSWGISFNIPENLRKMDFNIADITKDNYEEKIDEWLPYLKNDVLSLACCTMLYNEMMESLSGLNIQTSLSLPGLTYKAWMNKMNTKKEKIYASKDKYTRYFIRKSVKGGRVSANIRKFDKSKEIVDILNNYLEPSKDVHELVNKYNKLDKDSSTFKNITTELKKINKPFMTVLDVNSLYPSAMAYLDSEYPRIESARKFKKTEEREILNKFNTQTFRPKTGIFKILYEYPNDMFFTPIFCKDSVNKIEVLRSRTGKCCDILTSVDIQEIVRCGGRIIKIFDGIVFEENFEVNPFREFVLELYVLKAKFKREGNKVGYALVKLLLNSLYGKMVQKDINTKTHLWNEQTLKKNYTDDIKYEKIYSDKYYVEEDIGDSLPEILMPSHLGSFILSHSKRIMNDVILEIDGFKKPVIYYTDCDSIYVEEECVEILKDKGFLHNTELGKLSNDFDDDAKIFHGLFLAPKVKLCYALNNKGEIITKQTFKGYQRDILRPSEFIKMYNNEEINTEVDKPWTKKFTQGIFTPKDKQNKKFSANINLLKRKKPDSSEIMYPYNTSEIDSDMLNRYNINPEDLYIHEEIYEYNIED